MINMTRPEAGAKLREAVAILQLVDNCLDDSQTLCEHCGANRRNIYPEHLWHEKLKGIKERLETIAMAMERTPESIP